MKNSLRVTWRRFFGRWKVLISSEYKQLMYADLELVIHVGHKLHHRSPVCVKDGKLLIRREISPPPRGLIHIQIGTRYVIGIINQRKGVFEVLPEHLIDVAIESLEEKTGQEYILPVSRRQLCH